MKPFSINRNSWHYRLNRSFMNAYSYDMERYWEPRHNNFCSYWRATTRRLVIMILSVVIVMSFVISIVMIFIIAPVQSGLTVLIIAALFSGLALIVYLSNRPSKDEESTSLLAQRYRAYKSQVCPMIEYKTTE